MWHIEDNDCMCYFFLFIFVCWNRVFLWHFNAHFYIIRPTPFENVPIKSVSAAYLSTNLKLCNQTATSKYHPISHANKCCFSICIDSCSPLFWWEWSWSSEALIGCCCFYTTGKDASSIQSQLACGCCLQQNCHIWFCFSHIGDGNST